MSVIKTFKVICCIFLFVYVFGFFCRKETLIINLVKKVYLFMCCFITKPLNFGEKKEVRDLAVFIMLNNYG